MEPRSEFRDRCRLPSTVDADNKDDRRRAGGRQFAAPSLQELQDLGDQDLSRCSRIVGARLTYGLDELVGRIDTHVAGDQHVLDVLPEPLIELAGADECSEPARDRVPALREPRAK